MKAQSEIITFVLLFLIGLVLFISAFAWSQGVLQRSEDVNKLSSLEKFAMDLDSTIENTVKFGGELEVPFGYSATIGLVGEDTIEIRSPVSVSIPEQWINISTKYAFIDERKDGNYAIVRLRYNQNEKNYNILLFTDGPKLATPDIVKIQKNETYIEDGSTVIKLRIRLE